MYIARVFSQPSESIDVFLPVDGQRVACFIVVVMLNRHLVNMDTFLDAKFLNQNIEGGIQHTDHCRSSGSIRSACILSNFIPSTYRITGPYRIVKS